LIERKAGGEQFELPATTAAPTPVIDLMAALEASVKAAKEARSRHPSGGPEIVEQSRKRPAAARKAAPKPATKTAAAKPKAAKKPVRKSA
jgi:DNA end-binding protein Ku